MESEVRKRIKYAGDLLPFLELMCREYSIGDYKEHQIVKVGYEDFNLILQTSEDKFFVKIFADFRTDDESRQYAERISASIKAGVNHPKIIESPQGGPYIKEFGGYKFRLIIIEYIDGLSFFESNVPRSEEEKRFIVKQASIINSMDFKPPFIYDAWAIVNFAKEFQKVKDHLSNENLVVIEPLVEKFNEIPLNDLPHCFVHGDIMTTNVVKGKDGSLYIIDFGCSNYYPRIIELVVLLCDFLFDQANTSNEENIQLAIDEYQKIIKLTEQELEILPALIKIGFAMYLICGIYEREVRNNHKAENDYWIKLGMLGLEIK